jgi:acetylxylan esterase
MRMRVNMAARVAAAACAAIAVAAIILVKMVVPASAASLVQITNFGSNPTNLGFYLYVPSSAGAHPPILVALHQCTASGPGFFAGSEFANLANQYGFDVIYPSATRSGSCWDVSSSAALTRGGGSDPVGIMSMVTYTEQNFGGNPSQVYVTGASSGAMMTNVLLGDYPDVFKAGAAFMGVPFGCFAGPGVDVWNSACANGQISMTPQQWGTLVHNADPSYTGVRPRMQLWHGTADGTLNYNNFGEEIKQWTNVLGVSQTPTSTDQPQSGWTRTRYANSAGAVEVEAYSIAGAGHVLPLTGMAAYAIHFFGLDSGSTPPTSPPPTTPPPTTPPGTCHVTYAKASEWAGGFVANVTLADTGTAAINGWTLTFTFPGDQKITSAWGGTVSQSGENVTETNASYDGAISPGGSVSFGFQGTWTTSDAAPSSFKVNGTACT